MKAYKSLHDACGELRAARRKLRRMWLRGARFADLNNQQLRVDRLSSEYMQAFLRRMYPPKKMAGVQLYRDRPMLGSISSKPFVGIDYAAKEDSP